MFWWMNFQRKSWVILKVLFNLDPSNEFYDDDVIIVAYHYTCQCTKTLLLTSTYLSKTLLLTGTYLSKTLLLTGTYLSKMFSEG